ncbi:PEP-CTERM sorting domain-containing protein [Leptothoe kymatousa TAU-MAC 1615]|uniref:PEP-CTERM sorting domain-containing protein n=2 Tax=Leptothoe TaxID=2651725 RepID=A0ABS5Y3W1_9CYAN|nr:PEP-CTERM sorting domain-containing protein [Leptothoe kymatousa TAU-MAC 1615]
MTAPFAFAPVAQANDDEVLPIFSEFTIDSITAKVTKGINLTNDANGSLGAYSDFYYNDGTTNIDFNDSSLRKAVEGKSNAFTFGNESVVFNFDKALGQSRTDIKSDRWAPTGANAEKNTSDYLAVFQGNSVTVDLADSLNYFGMNWGALSSSNKFEFLQVDDSGAETSLGLFDYNNVFGSSDSKLPTQAAHQNNEYNGFVHFYANETDGLFNRIKITQEGGGGFETDNYSFRFSDESFDFEEGTDAAETPEPGALLGLVAMGGMFIRRRLMA